jgi:hypothetical protein
MRVITASRIHTPDAVVNTMMCAMQNKFVHEQI